jgi:hypothetical protein
MTARAFFSDFGQRDADQDRDLYGEAGFSAS